MPAMEAIYLIGSSDASVKCLLQDFSSQNRTTYKFAHVYFTEGNVQMIIGYIGIGVRLNIYFIQTYFQPVRMRDSRKSVTLSQLRGSRL